MIRILTISTLVLAAGQTAREGHTVDAIAKITEPRPLAQVQTAALIDRLAAESAEGIGSNSTAPAVGFLAIDEQPQFGGGLLGLSRSRISPIVRELVCRGVAALPILIQHLSDARPTKLFVDDGFVIRWFSDEYDGRDPKKQRTGVNRPDLIHRNHEFDRYTLKIGDLCYIAVGEIVNRDLLAVRCEPSLCLVVNSPIETPALAAAVKADWEGLTSEGLERSLRQDAFISAPSAVVRLLYYFPHSGTSLVIRMLDRPFYDEDVVYAFFSERLLTAKADSELENLLSEFRANHGESNYRGLLSTLAWASTFPQSQRDESRNRSKAVADGILVRFYPWFDPVRPPFLDAVKFREQKDLIVRLAPFSSPDIDRAILGVFRRCLAEKRSSVSAKIQRVDLVRACADRLMGKIPQHDCVQFLEAQSRELVEDRKDPRNSSLFTAIDQRIEMIRNLVDRLTKIEAK